MKQLLIRIILVLLGSLALHASARAQSFYATPDSGTAGSTLNVTIVGSGTHFKPSNSISQQYTQIALLRNGVTYTMTYPTSITSDTLLTASLGLSASLVSGWYDLRVARQDTQSYTYTHTNALYVSPAPGRLTQVVPAYSYTGQSTSIAIDGFNTTFSGTPSQITIAFKQGGSVVFQTYADSVIGSTKLTATVPASAPAGTYDITVTGPGFTYSASQFFTLYKAPGNQSFTVTPDSGAAATSLQVTIVGSGTHFAASGVLSGYYSTSITLGRSGQTYYSTNPTSISSDSLMKSNFSLPSNLATGWYDVTITQQSAPFYTCSHTSAFYVQPAPSKILSVSPQSGYQGQSLSLMIMGQSTTFTSPANQIAIAFKKGGNVVFQTVGDSIFSATRMSATIAIPASAASGIYDVSVTGTGFNYSGTQLFTVIAGPPPSISVNPDTGTSGTTLAVTITGQNTNFQPAQGISMPATITLSAMGKVVLTTQPTQVVSPSVMDATFTLMGIPDGTYDLEVKQYGAYDLFAKFIVSPHPLIVPVQHNPPTCMPGHTVSIDIHGVMTHFLAIGVNQTQAFLSNSNLDPKTRVTATSVAVQDDSTLTANFSIPAGYAAGAYTLLVAEPNGAQDTMSNALVVTLSSGVSGSGNTAPLISDLAATPNPAVGRIAIGFTLSKMVHVRLCLFDALGHTITTLCDREIEAGYQSFERSCPNLPEGNYFYELAVEGQRFTGKIAFRP